MTLFRQPYQAYLSGTHDSDAALVVLLYGQVVTGRGGNAITCK